MPNRALEVEGVLMSDAFWLGFTHGFIGVVMASMLVMVLVHHLRDRHRRG